MNCSWPLAILSISVLPPPPVSAGRTTCTISFRVSRMFATTACTPYLLMDFSACGREKSWDQHPAIVLCLLRTLAQGTSCRLKLLEEPEHYGAVCNASLWQDLHRGRHCLKT